MTFTKNFNHVYQCTFDGSWGMYLGERVVFLSVVIL